MGLGKFTELRGAWQERGGGVFKGGMGGGGVDTPMHTMKIYQVQKIHLSNPQKIPSL